MRAVASTVLDRAGRVWLVGGALRDLLIGRPVSEIDLVVAGDPYPLALEIEARGLGTAVCLSDVTPRVARVAGTSREVDLAELTGGSIEEDLARRDFTVNALAWEPGSERLIDPFGGAADLARRQLRLVLPTNVGEDPLRILRAARLFATHGLRPDREVASVSRSVAPQLAAIAPERIRAEIVKLLEADRAGGALRWLRDVGGWGPMFGLPGLLPPGSSGLLARVDAPSLRHRDPPSRRRLRLASIAAWFGLSGPQAARWLARRRFGRQEAADVAGLLDLATRAARLGPGRETWGWIRDAAERRAEAICLLALLEPARRSSSRRLARMRPARRVRVTGDDVMTWLGLSPGPEVGALLKELEIESLSGAVSSRAQARRWLLGAFAGRGTGFQDPSGPRAGGRRGKAAVIIPTR